MHMADALVAPAIAGTMYAASAAAAGYSIRRFQLTEDEKKVAVMGVMGAFVFSAQMINFTIPGTGASGHLCGGMMLSAMLGPFGGFLTMIGVLLIQCLLFADGGLLALGCNVWNMAFYGCFIGGFLIWKPMMKQGLSKKRIVVASILGCVLTLQLGAFSVVAETAASGITELPFTVFLAVMQPIHLAIGAVEGLITACVLSFVYEARPELLWSGRPERISAVVTLSDEDKRNDKNQDKNKAGRLSVKGTLGILAAAAVFIGGALSLAASAFPDGLEWSMEKLTGSTELAAEGTIYSLASQIQNLTALLPDYGFADSGSVLGTSFSGIVGGVAVIVLCFAVCRGIRLLRPMRDRVHE